MIVLLRQLETHSLAAFRSKSVTQFLPCVYCCYEKKHRNYSTLKQLHFLPGPGTRRFLQQQDTQFIYGRREYHWSLLHNVISGAQAYFEYIHATTGLDWWASLIVSIVPIRVVLTLCITALQSRNMKKVVTSHIMAMPEVSGLQKNHITPDKMMALVAKYKAKSPDEVQEIEKSIHEEVQRQYTLRRCHPYKNFGYGLMTLPMWVAGAFAIRNMTGSDVIPVFATCSAIESMSTGGCLWFKDFLAPDLTHILPIAEWVMMQLTFEFIISQIGDNRTGWVKYYIYFIRGWQVWTSIFVIYLWSKPSGMIYYWVLTTSSNLATNLWLQHPTVRRRLGLQIVTQTPYRDLYKKTYARYNIRQRLRDRKLRKEEEQRSKEEEL